MSPRVMRLALALVVSALLIADPPRQPVRASGMRRPIIFVDCAWRHPRDTWALPLGGVAEYHSMWDRLKDYGYVEDVDLFSACLAQGLSGDYTENYRTILMPTISRATARSGSPRVDVIACGQAALAARYYTVSEDYRGDVANLIMVAAPNQGSLAATLLRSAATAKAVTDLLRAAPASRWARPDREGDPRPELADLRRTALDFPPFTGETAYVTRRAISAYVPLVAYYRMAVKWTPRPDLRTGRPSVPFEDWLRREAPEVYDACFSRAQEPPVEPAYRKGGPVATPAPGTDLTRAYYEVLAVSAAQHYLTRTVLSERAVPVNLGELVAGVVGAPDPKIAAGKWVAKTAGQLGLKWLAENRDDLALAAGAAAFSADPRNVAFDRLVTSHLEIPAGSDWSGRALCDRILANYFLHYWNRLDAVSRAANEAAPVFDAASRPGPNVRYVTIAGSVANPYTAFIPWARDNDLFTEVDSALLPEGRDDVTAVFNSTISAGAGLLTRNNSVHRLIAEVLCSDYPIANRLSPGASGARNLWTWEKTVDASVGAWRPSYIEILPDRLAGSVGRIEVRLSFGRCPPGMAPRAWVYREDRDGKWVEQEELTIQAGSGGGVAVTGVDGFGRSCARLLVGYRYTTDSGLGQLAATPKRPVGGVVTATAHFRAEPREPDPSEPVLRLRRVLTESTETGDSPRAGTGDGSKSGTAEAPSEPFTGTGVEPPETIKVIRRTKETTHLEPVVVRHAGWQWDFGDGASLSDADPSHWSASVSHVFPGSGLYQVTAVSRADDGRMLVTCRQQVEVKASGAQAETATRRLLTAESIAPVKAEVRLAGPLEWVTGRPATFSVRADVERPGNCTGMTVTVDPGTRFMVTWERAGRFTVRAAAVVDLVYSVAGESVKIRNIYVASSEVNVLALSITD